MSDSIEVLHSDMVRELVKPGRVILNTLNPDKTDLMHATLGIVGEAGELADAIKKHIIYDRPLDRENVIEELGDLEFFMEQLRSRLDISREQTLESNMQKLFTAVNARYKEGKYSDEAATARADKVTGD